MGSCMFALVYGADVSGEGGGFGSMTACQCIFKV